MKVTTAVGMVKATATGAAITVVLGGTMAAPAAARSSETSGQCSSPSVLGTVTCTYVNPTVTDYVLRVPAGVTELHIEARGAGGGRGGAIEPARAPEGGHGGLVSADFPVATGDVVRVLVGGRGQDADGMKPGAGGLNGGASGGAGAPGGGGGGGASSVRLNGTDFASRILVAGGGGGAGGAVATTAASAFGGSGGGDYGGNGGGDRVGMGGEGATGPSGGAGLRRVTGQDGASGLDQRWGGAGGEGGFGTSNTIQHTGNWSGGPVGAGGGGGGYAGGSGGAAGTMMGGGGGGGSGFVATSVLAPSVARLGSAELTSGNTGCTEQGLVIITYQLPADQHVRS